MHNLYNFGLKEMIACQSFMRQSDANAESIERFQYIFGEVKIDE
jgi:hypothetical protein